MDRLDSFFGNQGDEGPPHDDFQQMREFLRLISTTGWEEPSPEILCRAFEQYYTASWSVLYTVNGRSGSIRPLTEHNIPDQFRKREEWSLPFVEEVVKTGLGQCTNGDRSEDREHLSPPPDSSIMTIPLFISGTITGALVLGRRAELPFSEEEVEQSVSLSPLAALFLSNLLTVSNMVEQMTRLEIDRKKFMELNKELLENIETLRANSDRLEKAFKELSEANNARTEFFENLSHELRTPLTPILASSEALLGNAFGNIPGEQKEIIEVLYLSAKRLELLIEDLLELVKLESRSLKIEMECLDATGIVEEGILETAPMAREKNVSLENELGEDLPFVSGDKKRLSQLIVNLLHNAIKFSHEGGTVRVQRVRDREDGGLLGIRVRDEGIGIPRDVLDKIFERFYQAGTPGTGDGLGLGLAIVKKIVEAHKGEVRVESEEGRGSSFTVYLPVYKD